MLSLQYGLLPHELYQRLSAAQEAALLSLYMVEPWGELRADIRTAQVSQLLWNANTSKKSSKKKLTDFLLFWRKPATEDPDVEDKIKDAFLGIANKAKQMEQVQSRPFGE